MLVVLAQFALADSAVQQAQEMLKEQGYYYGQITGEKNADTTAAIRRYQIRNGLQVTGDLNEETTRSLNANTGSSARVETEARTPERQAERAQPESGDDFRDETPEPTAPPVPRALSAPSRETIPPPRETIPPERMPVSGSVFQETPYATAPPRLQRQVLLGVQSSLRRRGIYRGPMDGVFGPELQFSLRAYQARVGLPASGRLDMDTLASLGLLPGQGGPRRGRSAPGPLEEPPVRGEWIHEN